MVSSGAGGGAVRAATAVYRQCAASVCNAKYGPVGVGAWVLGMERTLSKVPFQMHAAMATPPTVDAQ